MQADKPQVMRDLAEATAAGHGCAESRAPPEMRSLLISHATRRMETLTDIVFGLAMTSLVSRLPVPTLSQPAPTWSSLASLLGGTHLFALVMSFCISALYWFAHHRRLGLTSQMSLAQIFINFAFLFLIMLLPTTTDLYGRYGNTGSMVSIYCAHLAMLSLLHLVIWILTIRSSRLADGRQLPWRLAAGAGFGLTIFVLTTVAAVWRPVVSQFLMYLAFLSPLISRLASTGLDERAGARLSG